ncbi:STAS/SEC14 domain-containing protein [Candidatus Daviesbacteria bacterium]|nr:STAS/SEC14 domain-containing protein [Candidatus Daviesbacteria bacterium]
MVNSVFLGEDSFIYNLYFGDQNSQTVAECSEQIDKLAKELRKQHKKVLIIVDLTKMGKTHSSARKVGLEVLKNLDFDKLAIFGTDLYTKYLVNLVVLATGRLDKIQYFSNEEEARDWLKK